MAANPNNLNAIDAKKAYSIITKQINPSLPFGSRAKALTEKANIDLSNIAAITLSSIEPWLLCKPTIHFMLHATPKDTIPNTQQKMEFLEFSARFSDYTPVHTDGSKSINGTACAVVTKLDESYM